MAAQSKSGIFSKLLLWVRRDTTSTDWLIVILTGVIAGTSYLQWREIRSGSTDTHTLAQAADTQARKMGNMSDAADKIREAAQGMVTQEQRIADNAQQATKASNTQSESVLHENIAASHLEQRAWVAQIGIGVDSPEVGKTFRGYVTWRNSGKTFAKKVVPRVHMVFVPGLFATERDLMKTVGDIETEKRRKGVLACWLPMVSIRVPLRQRKKTAEIDKSRISGDWFTYVWGEMTYEDIFKEQHYDFLLWEAGYWGFRPMPLSQ